jgi:outer membrane protein, heavy metal efflux system
MNKNRFMKFIVVALFMMINAYARSQTEIGIKPDTLYLKQDSIESIFVRKNLLLLAQRFNIDAQKALVDQARLFPNPTFNINTNIYQTETKKFFPFGGDGEISAGLSQVVMLAGKHNKQLKMAMTNKSISEYQFYDLLRTLKHTLQCDFYNIHYLLQSEKVYDTEIAALKQVTDAFELQKGKGYVSEKEVLRVKAQLYSLQSEYNDLQSQINDVQSEMRLLLQIKNIVVIPVVDESQIRTLKANKYQLAAVIDSAYSTRPDLKIAKLNADLSKQNYNLQKAMAVPDLTLSLGYDQQGSYIHNLTTFGVGFDLPVLNRNQGNIKSAKAMIKYNEATYEATQASVNEQIYSALQKAIQNDKLLKGRDASFEKDYRKLLDEVLKNYQIRNISLLDFLDFYDSFKQNTLQVNTLNFNRLSAFIDLNYYSGIDYLKN